jgi:hypothetical protein
MSVLAKRLCASVAVTVAELVPTSLGVLTDEDSRSPPHPPSSSPTTAVKCVDNTSPTQAPSNSDTRNPNDSLKALDRIGFILDVLGDVAELVPVAGLASTVPIIRRIVDQLRVSILLPHFASLELFTKLRYAENKRESRHCK